MASISSGRPSDRRRTARGRRPRPAPDSPALRWWSTTAKARPSGLVVSSRTTSSPSVIERAPGPLGSGTVTSAPSSAPLVTRTCAVPQPFTSSSSSSTHGTWSIETISPLNCSAEPDGSATVTSDGDVLGRPQPDHRDERGDRDRRHDHHRDPAQPPELRDRVPRVMCPHRDPHRVVDVVDSQPPPPRKILSTLLSTGSTSGTGYPDWSWCEDVPLSRIETIE